MPAPDFDSRLLSDVRCTCERGWWYVTVTYDGQRYQLGEWRAYPLAQHACTLSALEKALGSADKRALRKVVEARHEQAEERTPEPGMQVAHPSPIAGAITNEQLQHREQFWAFVHTQAEPRYRERLTRLLGVWEEANQAYYRGVLVPPIILLAEPSNQRRLGDCGPVSGWGAQSQIRLRPSLLDGTHPDMRGGSHDPEGMFRFVADVLLHEQIHQWQQEITGQREESYHGHGPDFCARCNAIGARLGLAPVIVKTRPGHRDIPRCANWPHNVRPPDYYLGAYIPASGDADHI